MENVSVEAMENDERNDENDDDEKHAHREENDDRNGKYAFGNLEESPNDQPGHIPNSSCRQNSDDVTPE